MPLRHAEPDAAIAAGDDGDLALQIERFHRCTFYSCWLSFLALALPDQDEADGRKRRAISRPLDLIDHEAGSRPGDHTCALADPEQPDRERDQPDCQKQFS